MVMGIFYDPSIQSPVLTKHCWLEACQVMAMCLNMPTWQLEWGSKLSTTCWVLQSHASVPCIRVCVCPCAYVCTCCGIGHFWLRIMFQSKMTW